MTSPGWKVIRKHVLLTLPASTSACSIKQETGSRPPAATRDKPPPKPFHMSGSGCGFVTVQVLFVGPPQVDSRHLRRLQNTKLKLEKLLPTLITLQCSCSLTQREAAEYSTGLNGRWAPIRAPRDRALPGCWAQHDFLAGPVSLGGPRNVNEQLSWWKSST